MNVWKASLLHVYYYGSLPYRWWARRRARATGRTPVLVLFYHRVADDGANPWTVSNRAFARQMAWLRRRLELVSLEEAQRRIRSGRNGQPCASVTFDDGYAENCERAIPLLIREHVPCTYFVTLRNVLEGEPFAHDLAAGRGLAPNTPGQLRRMAVAGIEIGCHGYSHTDLARAASERELRREIEASGRGLEELVGRRVRYFAFPFGQRQHLSAAAFALAKEAGYEAACSAYGAYNFPGDDAFHLQRIAADESTMRLRNWATVDPRKLRIPRFPWRPAPEDDARPKAEPEAALRV